MLKVGDAAPPIEAVGSDGKRFALYEQPGLCTVIYFFPKAFTPGCTAETKEFRKHYIELELAGATLVGVSTDDRDTQCRFATLPGRALPHAGRPRPVHLPRLRRALADHRRRAPRHLRGGAFPAPTGRARPRWTVEAVFRHELDIGAHRDEVLRFVNTKFQALSTWAALRVGCAPHDDRNLPRALRPRPRPARSGGRAHRVPHRARRQHRGQPDGRAGRRLRHPRPRLRHARARSPPSSRATRRSPRRPASP